MSQKLAQMTTENGGADGLALCDWASGPLSLALCFFLPARLGDNRAGGPQQASCSSRWVRPGLGWAGLCRLTVLPVGSLVGFRNGVFCPWDG